MIFFNPELYIIQVTYITDQKNEFKFIVYARSHERAKEITKVRFSSNVYFHSIETSIIGQARHDKQEGIIE